MRANVKPLTHWVIYKGYTVRFSSRSPQQVAGTLITPEGTIDFRYDPVNQVVILAGERITINDYGWEVVKEPHGQTQ
jgi:hypothetical protein